MRGILDANETGAGNLAREAFSVASPTKGLLQRRRNRTDARVVTVHLTDKGRQVLREVEPAAAQADAAVEAALPQERRTELLRSLTTIVTTLTSTRVAVPKKRRR